MITRRSFLDASAAAAAALVATGLPALAAAWPSQPLRIIVPVAPGGTSDVIARLISKPLTDALGVAVLIDNRTGAAGMLGAAAVASATNGHTVLLSDLGSLAIAPLITKDLSFKPEALQGVSLLAWKLSKNYFYNFIRSLRGFVLISRDFVGVIA